MQAQAQAQQRRNCRLHIGRVAAAVAAFVVILRLHCCCCFYSALASASASADSAGSGSDWHTNTDEVLVSLFGCTGGGEEKELGRRQLCDILTMFSIEFCFVEVMRNAFCTQFEVKPFSMCLHLCVFFLSVSLSLSL